MEGQENFSAKQQELCRKFLDSLDRQVGMLHDEKIPSPVKANLNQAQQAIIKMKELLV